MRKTGALLLSTFLVVAAAGGLAGLHFYRQATEPFKGYGEAECFVEVPNRSSSRVIGEKLVEAGVVRDRLTFRLALLRTGVARRLKAGEYRFDHPMSAVEVVSKIARGEVYLRPITFPEGLTLDDYAAIFEQRGFGPAASFRAAASDASLVSDLDPGARDLEGYLFPETYTLPRRAGAAELVRMMVSRFREVFAPLAPEAAARNMTVREVVTVASMVEKETARSEERPTIAAVYLNRLRIRMGLQCDPTVIYALRRAGRYDGNLTRDDLAFASPYNTYLHAGLPPGPIASPGRASLEATVRPAEVNYLYFVSRNDGTHVFARTLEEQNRNVYKYQVRFFRQQGRGRSR
jgi:UPF0755 protein